MGVWRDKLVSQATSHSPLIPPNGEVRGQRKCHCLLYIGFIFLTLTRVNGVGKYRGGTCTPDSP